jgi:hypothetical protein
MATLPHPRILSPASNRAPGLERQVIARGPRLFHRGRRRHVPRGGCRQRASTAGNKGPARSVGRPCTARAVAADIRAGGPGRKSPLSHIMGVLFQDYGLAPLRRAALLARKLVRSSVQLAVVPLCCRTLRTFATEAVGKLAAIIRVNLGARAARH